MMNRITGFLLALMSFCSTWKAFSCVTDGATVGMDFQIFTCMFVGLSVARNDGNISVCREELFVHLAFLFLLCAPTEIKQKFCSVHLK